MAHNVNVQMDADALGQALGNALAGALPGAGAGKKVPTLESVDPDEWLEWKRRFRMVAQIADWNDLRKRRELYAAMKGPAAKAVNDIAVEDPPGGPPAGGVALTYAAVEASYEARFLTAAASDQARADFQVAAQQPEETMLAWHGRCRELFLRAFPTANANGGATGQMLKDRFVMGVEVRAVREFLWDQRPNTYVDCLTVAQTKEATLRLMEEGKKKPSMNAVGTSSGKTTFSDNRCFFCSQEGHQQRNCPQLDKARQLLTGRTPFRGAGGFRGNRRWRGGNQKRRREGQSTPRGKAIAAMDAPSEERRTDAGSSSSNSSPPSGTFGKSTPPNNSASQQGMSSN